MELFIRSTAQPSERPVEIVERKGLGHPDTICDGVAEAVSRALCQHYGETFGRILHHNVDKVLLVGGQSRVAFGGGDVVQPIELYLAGRATSELEGKRLAVDEIAEQACRDWLKTHVRHLDVDRHVRIVPRIRAGSTDLAGLFARGDSPLSNDTSCGAGFAPLTELERVVLEVEQTLNARDTHRVQPAIGEDIKVMGVRVQDTVSLTIGCAFVAAHVSDLASYRAAKEAAGQIAMDAARRHCQREVRVQVNAADDLERGELFLTATGTSAESGDDGEVGRGNRVNGLITPYRPMTMEAAAGKNPVNHVGKLYNLAAGGIAEAVASNPAVQGVTCILLSQIGRPVHDPHVAELALQTEPSVRADTLRGEVEAVVREQLDGLSQLGQNVVEGKLRIY